MNKRQADDWAKLAHFIKDQVPGKNLNQRCFIGLAEGETREGK